MGATLVTGGSGFLGTHIVRALAKRGDELRLMVRKKSRLSHLEGLEFDTVTGDITDRKAVRRAVGGVDKVFHVAGSTSMRSGSERRVFEVNVSGTRNLMEEALRAGVGRVIHTSSAAAFGPAERGGAADETQLFSAAHLGLAYVTSKHEAEMEALRVAALGLDVVVVNPTFVLGPEDPTESSGGVIKRALLRQLPAFVDGGLNVVDVRDVAKGHLLADAKGATGERYILGGRNFTLARLFADIARISDVPPPPIQLPDRVTIAAAAAAQRLGLGIPVSDQEVRSATQWWTYRSTKARRELGFRARPHEDTLEAAVSWYMGDLGDRIHQKPRSDAALRGIGRALKTVERIIP